jgi:hypothetical protein
LCGDSRYLPGRFLSLQVFAVSGGDLGGPVSASKNPVPGGRGHTRLLPHGRQISAGWQRRFLGRAIVADLTQALRTADSIPLEHRQPAFVGGSDQGRREEGARDGQVDLGDAALFAGGNLLGLSALIGAISLSGSLIAWAKLQGVLKTR